jgi:hypothetical protein
MFSENLLEKQDFEENPQQQETPEVINIQEL